MKQKERLITVVHASGKLLKDFLLKKPKHVIIEEARLVQWHWNKFFNSSENVNKKS